MNAEGETPACRNISSSGSGKASDSGLQMGLSFGRRFDAGLRMPAPNTVRVALQAAERAAPGVAGIDGEFLRLAETHQVAVDALHALLVELVVLTEGNQVA